METFDNIHLGWCSILEQNLVLPKQDRRSNRDDILSVVSEEFPIRTEHDTIEKVEDTNPVESLEKTI